MTNGNLARLRAYFKMLGGIVCLALLVYLVIGNHIDYDRALEAVLGLLAAFGIGDGIAKLNQQ